MIYEPNLPSVRALFRAIQARDVKAAAAALAAGAPAQSRTGSGFNGSQATCSALMKALDGQDGGSPALFDLLLDHGADLFQKDSMVGRFPLEELLRRDHPRVTAAVIKRWGGIPAFARALRAAGSAHAELALRALAMGSLSADTVKAQLFFELWDTCPREVTELQGTATNEQTKWPWPWPWHWLIRKPVPPLVREALEQRVALPTPESLGAEAWMLWIEVLAGHGSRQGSALFRELLKNTPAEWWLDRNMPPRHRPGTLFGGPDQFRQTLLEALLVKGSVAGMKTFRQVHPDGNNVCLHADRLWKAVGRRAALGAASILKKVCPPEQAGPLALGETLCAVLEHDRDPQHRVRLAHALIDAGAQVDVVGKQGATALHWLVKWREKGGRRAELIHRLLAAGARWDSPLDHAGRSPASAFRESDPKGWARWQATVLDQQLAAGEARCRARL